MLMASTDFASIPAHFKLASPSMGLAIATLLHHNRQHSFDDTNNMRISLPFKFLPVTLHQSMICRPLPQKAIMFALFHNLAIDFCTPYKGSNNTDESVNLESLLSTSPCAR